MAEEKKKEEMLEGEEMDLDALEQVSGGTFMEHVKFQETTPISTGTKENI